MHGANRFVLPRGIVCSLEVEIIVNPLLTSRLTSDHLSSSLIGTADVVIADLHVLLLSQERLLELLLFLFYIASIDLSSRWIPPVVRLPKQVLELN